MPSKIKAIFLRLTHFLRFFPVRLQRLFWHLGRGLTLQVSKEEYWKEEAKNSSWGSVVFLWLGELGVLILECAGIGELYETVMDLVKSKSRPLTGRELQIAQSVYGESIDYQRVRVDESAWLGPKQYRFCYVSFFLINSWGRMSDHVLIHELMHIWQYQQMGAIYMIRALIGQRTRRGYDYGGIENLQQKLANGQTILDYNLEQQAEVVTDYFLLKNGYAPQWGAACEEDIGVYEWFLKVIKMN